MAYSSLKRIGFLTTFLAPDKVGKLKNRCTF